MDAQPILETERLFLTVFTEGDVPKVARLAGDRSIADTTLHIPHPYAEEDARAWIATHELRFREGKSVNE
jgi:ribosomal-protein-alanine N-acetyltransferase